MPSNPALAYRSQAMMCSPGTAPQRQRIYSPHTSELWEVYVTGFLCPKSNALLVSRQLNKCSLLGLSRKHSQRLRVLTTGHTSPIRGDAGLWQKACSE